MQTRKQISPVGLLKEDRMEKVKEHCLQMNRQISSLYEKLPQEKVAKFWKLVDSWSEAIERYMKVEEVWESKVIDVVGSGNGHKFITKDLSTTTSVMDRACELFAFSVEA